MADKLSESTWTGFLKKQKLELDDKALVKALAAFDRTDEAKPEPRLKALDEVIKQIPEQVKALVKRKKELGDKPFGAAKDQLSELLEVAERLHKDTTQAVAEAQAQAQAKRKDGKDGKDAAGDDEEDEESPALLTVKMKPLLRELRKGEVGMPFLIAVAGKETVLLVSRRAISPARGKLLKSQMAQTSGLKFIRGECRYENSALTFVVQSPGAALAKRLRQALLNQTEMKWKVRVRGEDGVEEEDGEDEEVARKPATAEQLAYTQRLLKVRERYQKALADQHPEAVQLKALMEQAGAKVSDRQDYAGATADLAAMEDLLNAAPKADPGVDAGVAFKARLTALIPRMNAAQTAGHVAAKQAKLKASEAGVQARKKDFAGAAALLDEVERLLQGLEDTGTAARTDRTDDDGHQIRDRLAALQDRITRTLDAGGRLATELRGLPATLEAQLERGAVDRASLLLERIERLLAEAQDEHARYRSRLTALVKDLAHAEGEVARQIAALEKALQASADEELRLIGEAGLTWILGDHGARVSSLITAVVQAEPAARGRAADVALQGVGGYLDHLESSQEIAACDGNDLGLEVSIRGTLTYALEAIGETLAEV